MNPVEQMLAVPELVEKLRSDEIESLRSEVKAGRREHILRTMDQRGIAQELIRQQYTGRYPFELLQNADDAAAEGSPGTVRFHLTSDALIVADQGSGFGPDEVRAICGLGRSSKDPRKSIGYKGLGFKSVGEITERPQISSVAAAFMFDETAVKAAVEEVVGSLPGETRLPIYAFPFDVAEEDLGADAQLVSSLHHEGFASVFRLPLKVGVGRDMVELHLQNTLAPRLLLLLANTRRLEVLGTSQDFSATIELEDAKDYREALLDVDGKLEHWLVFTQKVRVPDPSMTASLGDTWKEVKFVTASAAVPLADDGRPDHGLRQPVHVYFPTVEQSGLSIIVHGDFALELDRRHVALTPEASAYNQWLAEQVGSLVASRVAPALSKRFPGDARVVAALAPVAAGSDFGETILEKIVEALARSRFVPVVDGRARLPGETLLLPDSIPDARSAHACLNASSIGRLAIPDVEDHGPSRSLLTNRLGVLPMSPSEAADLLAEPTVGDESRMYEFLLGWAESYGSSRLAGVLSDVPCVRTLGGGWARPSSGLFFGRQKGELDLPDDLEVPIVDVPDMDGLVALLQDAGVRPFEWRQLLPEFVLPLLTSSDTSEARRDSAMRALRGYYKAERSGDPRIRSQIARVLLPGRSNSSLDTELRPAGELYFAKEWVGHDRLERIYGGFGTSDFLAVSPSSDDEESEEERAFLEWVGVAARPRLDAATTEQRGTYLLENLSRHPHREYGEHWSSWLESSSITGSRLCHQHHGGQQLRKSFSVDRLHELIDRKERSRLVAMWQALVEEWSHYESSLSAEIYCSHGWHTGSRTREVPSLTHHMLTENTSVPAIREAQPTLARPKDTWRLAHDTPRRIAHRVDVLDPVVSGSNPAASVMERLGVVDAARPSPTDLMNFLEALAKEHRDGVTEGSDIYEAARWAMRTLDDVLDRSGEPIDACPPLLARLRGQRVFHRAPAVANDPLLEETWESEMPILDGDRDLRRLHHAFGLRNLDDEVERLPFGQLVSVEAREKVRLRLDRAKPFLAALAARETPSREDEVFRGLARLEVMAYSELRLKYRLDGMERIRDEAASYLAVRREKSGRRRNIGTAHLEVDPATNEPHWFVFGPQLAQFLSVPTQADAFALLLESNREGRERFLAARRVDMAAVEEARIKLNVMPEDETLDGLVSVSPITEHGEDGLADEQPRSNEAADADAQRPDQSESVEPAAVQEIQMPPLDFDRIEMSEGTTAPVPETPQPQVHVRGGGLGPSGPVDFEVREGLQRRIGRRGEEAAYESERKRLVALGLDPGAVVWRSELHPFAPYDIESLDEDAQRIFIEVKATSAPDPDEPFEISNAELGRALVEGDRYYVYRVTSADSSAPRIYRYRDLIRLLRTGRAEIRVSGARVGFHHEDEVGDSSKSQQADVDDIP